MPYEPATGMDRMMGESLHGTLERIVYANEATGWTVVRLRVSSRRDPVTAVGNLLSVHPGEELRLTGTWAVDPKYGEQFRVETCTTLLPATLVGIEKYLGSGFVRGIGPTLAARLVQLPNDTASGTVLQGDGRHEYRRAGRFRAT